MTKPKFTKGQRVLYLRPINPVFPNAPVFASLGNYKGVMHLNHRGGDGNVLPITGVILDDGFSKPDGSIDYNFRPDGWPTPMSQWPHGFAASEAHLSELEDPDQVIEGTVTDKSGNPLE